MGCRIAVLLLSSALAASAAYFQDFQAARAVIGQASFSARDKGIIANALSLSKKSLFVADASGQLLTYDLSQIGSAQTAGCAVCLATPQSYSFQNVFEGVASVAVNGQKIAIADAKGHRVLLWNGSSQIEMTGFSNPVSVAFDSQRLYVGDAGTHHVFIWNHFPSSSTQSPDATLGTSESFDLPSADTIESPVAMVADGSNLFVADGSAHRVLVFSAADSKAPEITNAATLTPGPLAPGTLISVSGTASQNILLNGLPLKATDQSGDQLQAQIPYDLNNAMSGILWVENQTENGSVSVSRPVAVRFTAASPGIFAFGLKEPRTGLILHNPDQVPLSPENPAKPSEVLTVWATGLGAIRSEKNSEGGFDVTTPVRASVNGIAAEVLSAMLPAEATGVYEVRLRLPTELSANPSLMLTQNDIKSNAVAFPAKAN